MYCVIRRQRARLRSDIQNELSASGISMAQPRSGLRSEHRSGEAGSAKHEREQYSEAVLAIRI